MKYRLLDLLACPVCRDKGFPLEIIVYEEKILENIDTEYDGKPLCRTYCGYLRKYIGELDKPPPCRECLRREIVKAVLICPRCRRKYYIVDGIPVFIDRGKQ